MRCSASADLKECIWLALSDPPCKDSFPLRPGQIDAKSDLIAWSIQAGISDETLLLWNGGRKIHKLKVLEKVLSAQCYETSSNNVLTWDEWLL
jgi:hypothetical protein